jgi:hypothetical protein
MIRQRYWVSALMAVTALAGTVVTSSTSIETLGQRYDSTQQAQHRGSGRLTETLTTTGGETSNVFEELYGDSHRGSGRLTADATAPTTVLAWRGTGRISAVGSLGAV